MDNYKWELDVFGTGGVPVVKYDGKILNVSEDGFAIVNLEFHYRTNEEVIRPNIWIMDYYIHNDGLLHHKYFVDYGRGSILTGQYTKDLESGYISGTDFVRDC
jgi:hypothetical protein